MVMMGSITLVQAGPCRETLAAARGVVAYTVFNITDRVWSIFITQLSAWEMASKQY